MADRMALKCGCELTFSDSYPHMIILRECRTANQDQIHRTDIHRLVSDINTLIDAQEMKIW